MHKLLLQSLAILLSVVGAAGGALSEVTASEPAPDFALRSLNGPNLRSSEFRSEVVVLNFWASWCARCPDLLPVLETLHRTYAADGVNVLAVAIDGDVALARRTAVELGISYPLLLDESGVASRAYDPGKLPFTVVIGRNGQIEHVEKGFGRDSAARIAEAIDAAVAGQ